MYEIKNKDTVIDLFRGEYAFLSNFYDRNKKFTYKGMSFTNSEAAFQSQKCLEREKEFVGLKPSESKKLGRKVLLRDDWNEVRNDVMYDVCKAKFTQDHQLLLNLLLTGDRELVEGKHHDDYWGMVWKGGKWVGENNLGIVLMKLRDDLKKELGLEDVEVPCDTTCIKTTSYATYAYMPESHSRFYNMLNNCLRCEHSDACEITHYIEAVYIALHPEEKAKRDKAEASMKEMVDNIINKVNKDEF